MTNQLRPQGDPSAPMYAPSRDIAHLMIPMMHEVFLGLSRENWTPEYEEWFAREGITEEDIGKGAAAFAAASRTFIRDDRTVSVTESLERGGVMALPPAVRYAIFARIGHVVYGGWFYGIRDVTLRGVKSSMHDEFVEMVAAGRAVAAKLSGHTPQEVDTEEYIQRESAEEWRRLYMQQSEVVAQQLTELTEKSALVLQYEERLKECQAGMSQRALEPQDNVTTYREQFELPDAWWARFWVVGKLAWRLLRYPVA